MQTFLPLPAMFPLSWQLKLNGQWIFYSAFLLWALYTTCLIHTSTFCMLLLRKCFLSNVHIHSYYNSWIQRSTWDLYLAQRYLTDRNWATNLPIKTFLLYFLSRKKSKGHFSLPFREPGLPCDMSSTSLTRIWHVGE